MQIWHISAEPNKLTAMSLFFSFLKIPSGKKIATPQKIMSISPKKVKFKNDFIFKTELMLFKKKYQNKINRLLGQKKIEISYTLCA
mgnify:CR=1 FL=1